MYIKVTVWVVVGWQALEFWEVEWMSGSVVRVVEYSQGQVAK